MSSVIDLLLDHSLTLILFTCLLVLAFHVFSASWLPGPVQSRRATIYQLQNMMV